MNAVLWMAVSACLLTACVMDCLSGEVYNFIWWIGGAAAALLLCRRGISVGRLFALGCFCLLQLTIFAKMYGKADCYAFCVCALTLAAAGWGFPEFLFQMILAFGILAVVQLFRRNIDKVGNLKEPVPFLPYISLSFGLFFLFCDHLPPIGIFFRDF